MGCARGKGWEYAMADANRAGRVDEMQETVVRVFRLCGIVG